MTESRASRPDKSGLPDVIRLRSAGKDLLGVYTTKWIPIEERRAIPKRSFAAKTRDNMKVDLKSQLGLSKPIAVSTVPPKRLHDVIVVLELLLAPFMLMGDFNAFNMLLADTERYQRWTHCPHVFGLKPEYLEQWSPTHFCVGTSSMSAIDLTVMSTSITQSFEWEMHFNLFGSDNFLLIVLYLFGIASDTRWPESVLKKTDWQGF